MLDVIGGVCGLHAQVASSTELQIWARVDGVSPDEVRDALWEHRSLVRTWAMRGTLHVLPASDLSLFVAALRTHDRWWKGAWLRMIGFGAQELRQILDAIRDSLGARPITREQLADRVAERVDHDARERMLSGWGEMLKPAAFEGSLISGPPQGQSVTFVRPDRWLRAWNEPPPEEAWREIVRRYLRVYGPAARQEFARWWGMQPAPAGRVLQASEDELTEVDVEGYGGFALTADLDVLQQEGGTPPVRLLPMFDPYVVGTRPRSSLVDPAFEDRVFRSAGWISPALLIDGMVAGVWSHQRRRDRLEVGVEPFERLPAATHREIEEEADRLGAFLDAPVDLSVRRVTERGRRKRRAPT